MARKLEFPALLVLFGFVFILHGVIYPFFIIDLYTRLLADFATELPLWTQLALNKYLIVGLSVVPVMILGATQGSEMSSEQRRRFVVTCIVYSCTILLLIAVGLYLPRYNMTRDLEALWLRGALAAVSPWS